MRFMVIVRASADSATGEPGAALMPAMGKYNEELVKAGVLLDANGLLPSSDGARVRFSGDMPTVIDGPFADSKELVAGYWIFQCKSRDEAIEWVKRCPIPIAGAEIEIRRIAEAEDRA